MNTKKIKNDASAQKVLSLSGSASKDLMDDWFLRYGFVLRGPKVMFEGQTYARREWVKKSELIHDHYVLKTILDQCNPSHVVLFDLDSTLFEVGPRTEGIIKEWSKETGFHSVRERLLKLQGRHVGYHLTDYFLAAGIQPELEKSAFEELSRFWFDRFFQSEYLKYDLPYEGAVSFVNAIYNKGAQIVYLTGRDAPNMKEGTVESLIHHGFPMGERVTLILKDKFETSDFVHKVNAVEEIKKRGELLVSFENEPKNLVLLRKAFPDAIHVFLDTILSEDEAPLVKDVYRISSFEMAFYS